MNTFNPTFDGGGHIVPTPMISGCSSLNIDLEGAKFWYNSYFIVTMDIQKVLNLKGVSKKIWSIFLEAGVKNQNFKLEPIGLKFCRGLGGPKMNFFCFLNHIVLGLYLKVMAIFKKKM